MGAGALIPTRFIYQDEIVGQGKEVLVLGKAMHLKNHDVDRLYHEFCKHEDKKTHLMHLNTFYNRYKIKKSPFLDIYFQLFDKKKTGFLPFEEFMVSSWNFLSSNDEIIATFCFQLFDVDRSNTVTIDELKFMLAAAWDFNIPSKFDMVLDNLKKNKDGLITLVEFILLHRYFPQILSPIYDLRKQLRRQVVFRRFWREQTKRRFEIFQHLPIFAIVDRDDPDYISFTLEYLSSRKGTPQPFAEQWRNNLRRRKLNKFKTFDIPTELIEFNPPVIKAKKKRNKWKDKRNSMVVVVPVLGSDLKPRHRRDSETSSIFNDDDVAVDDGDLKEDELNQLQRFVPADAWGSTGTGTSIDHLNRPAEMYVAPEAGEFDNEYDGPVVVNKVLFFDQSIGNTVR